MSKGGMNLNIYRTAYLTKMTAFTILPISLVFIFSKIRKSIYMEIEKV
jgi:hypothetical protein